MDSHESRESSPELRLWVRACSDLLDPPSEWEPNVNLARARFEIRADARSRRRSAAKRYWLSAAVAALLLCILVPTIPQTRAFAQQIGDGSRQRLEQLWYWITIVRPGPMLLRRLPDAVAALHSHPVAQSAGAQEVSSASEAALRAGFDPRLPDPGILSGSPRLSVLGPRSFVAVIRTADLDLELRKAGVDDAPVPKEWDGAQLNLQIGPTVTAAWRNVTDSRAGIAWSELILEQAPARVEAPSGIDLEGLGGAVLRAAGLRNRDLALRLARLPASAPTLLFGYAPPNLAGVREVNLQAGPAILIEEFDLKGGSEGFGPRVDRLTVLWNMPDRMYRLSGTTTNPVRIHSGGLAAALASVIDLANSTLR